MLTIPNSIKTLFKTDGTRKNFRVQFPNGELPDITNDNIVRESVHFTESICSQSTFRFGLAEASVIEFETVGIGNMYGYTIECAYEIDTSSLSAAEISAIQSDPEDGELVLASASDIGYGFYRVPLGVFRVERCPRNHGAMTHRQVTAYTASVLSSQTVPGLPTLSVWSAITARLSAFKALALGTGLSLQSTQTAETQNSFYGEVFYNASGTQLRLSVTDVDGSSNMFKQVKLLPWNATTIANLPAFISAEMPGFNPSNYEGVGVAIAEAITNAGFDICYNSSRVKIFENNETALRSRCPWLFYPCIMTTFENSGGSVFNAMFQKVEAQTLTPVIAMEGTTAQTGFFVRSGNYTPKQADFLCLGKYSAGTNVRVTIGSTNLTPALSGYLTVAPTVSLYGLTDYGNTIDIQNVGTSTGQYINGTSIGSMSDTAYSFAGAVNLLDIINGLLEVEGNFAKADRFGAFEELTLSPSSPISISPGDYDEVWWDEYDVSPIGTVTVTYRNGEEGEATANVTLGAGASLYDMTDNEVLKNLSTADLDSITTLLSGDFATNAQNVGFTPIEMTMQGWPWLEAGDALQITAEDGTIVNTYALRVEMSGIQHLMSDITAEGGEIIGEV